MISLVPKFQPGDKGEPHASPSLPDACFRLPVSLYTEYFLQVIRKPGSYWVKAFIKLTAYGLERERYQTSQSPCDSCAEGRCVGF